MVYDYRMWYCFFQTLEGIVLISQEGFDSSQHATMHGKMIMDRLEAFDLLDPDDELVPATLIDIDEGFTVERLED